MKETDIEKIVRNILSEELGNTDQSDNENLSPDLKEIRDSVQKKIRK